MKVPEWCKKPGATRICYVTCPMAETGEPKWMALDTDSDPEPDWCKVVDCTKPGASQICHVTCPKEQFLVRPEKDSFWARMSKSDPNMTGLIRKLVGCFPRGECP